VWGGQGTDLLRTEMKNERSAPRNCDEGDREHVDLHRLGSGGMRYR
jgi:hypothetical protein